MGERGGGEKRIMGEEKEMVELVGFQ